MIPFDIISRKRDGGRHSIDELEFLVSGFTAGEIPDSQMASWLMAVYLRGLDLQETADLTSVMIDSGSRIDLSGIDGTKVDKHSTGGIGDKLTLVVVPLVAAAGLKVPKLSGRALGHTGGTLDKLESIPGFKTSLSREQVLSQLEKVGAVVAASTLDLAPADKKIYGLRNQTATVASAPLIVASILSKKAAGGATNILVDVKTGTGAFMSGQEEAKSLAVLLQSVGQLVGLKVGCVVSDMNQPLGTAVGNSLEVREAIDCLAQKGPADLREMSVYLAAEMLSFSESIDRWLASEQVERVLASGKGLDKFAELIDAQGGDSRVCADPSRLPTAPKRAMVHAEDDGFLVVTDCKNIGLAAATLSGQMGDAMPFDFGAGLLLRAKHGEKVARGAPLVELVFSETARLPKAERLIHGALTVSPEPPTAWPLIYEG